MKKLYSFVLGFLLFFWPIAVKAVEIAEAPKPNPMSEEVIRYLQVEEMYQGSLSWQGNKASTKYNYNLKKKK